MKFIKNFLIVLFIFIVFLTIVNYLPKISEIFNDKFSVKKNLNISNIKLITHKNDKFDKSFLGDRPSAFFFGFTHCPDICPLTLYKVSEAVNSLEINSDFNIFFVTLDPERDKPFVLKNYLEFYNGNIIGLTGKLDEINKLSKLMNINFVKRNVDDTYTIDHSASVILLDKNFNKVDQIFFDDDIEVTKNKIQKTINIF